MSRAKIVDHYIEKSYEEGFKIDQIRKELEEKNIPDEEIRIIADLVEIETKKRILNNRKMNMQLQVGAFLTLFGAGIILLAYFGIVNFSFHFIILFAPFLIGLVLLMRGIANAKNQ